MRGRFTLVELMIVVAIVMVLAAIAIPNFYTMQLKAKISEMPVNADGVITAEVAYAAANDAFYGAAGLFPSGTVGKSAKPWPTSAGAFDVIGWAPDGAVRCSYNVVVIGCFPSKADFGGNCDIDGDGQVAVYDAHTDFERKCTTEGARWIIGPPTRY